MSNTEEPNDVKIDHRGFFLTEYSHPVRVKEAVAAMEAKINANSNNVTPTVRLKPPKVIIRPKDPAELKSHKEKHRRSLSDPNAIKKHVKEMKEMWNQKVDSQKQTNLIEVNTLFGDNSPSLSSIDSDKNIDKQLVQNDNVSLKNTEADVKINLSNEAVKSSQTPPVVSPRPKNHVLRPRSVTVGQLNLTGIRNTERTDTKDRDSPLETEKLSFSEKAKIFGGTKPNLKGRIRRYTDVPPPSTPAYRRSWSEDSTQQMGENSNKDTGFDIPYSRVRNDASLNGLFEKMKAREEKKLEEEKMVINLQKNARLAKDKRKLRTSTGSSSISTPSDDEEKIKSDYIFSGVRRRSKDVVKPASKELSPLAFQKTENSIFGSSFLENDNSRQTSEEAEFAGSRRISALQRLLENKNYDSIIQPNKQSSTSNDFSSNESSISTSNKNSILSRPTKLTLYGCRERAGTETSVYLTEVIQNKCAERSGSLENVNLAAENKKISPATPDKRSSGFSENEDDVNKEPFPIIVKTTPSGSSEIAEPDMNNEVTSQNTELSYLPFETDTSTATSSPTVVTPSLSEINLLEEYDKIAKQLKEEERDDSNTTQEKHRSLSEDSSTMSIDSGYRNSLEERRWSDSTENSSSDEEERVVDMQSNKSENITPTPGTPLQEATIEVKLHNIAKELLSTEESYVSVLHLIDQVFHKRILEAAVEKHIMPEQVVGKIFAHVPAIYSFHSSFLLPQLQDRLAAWHMKPCIGDIMTKAAPFLKMYSLYVQHFDEAMKLIKLWSERSNGFDLLIKNIQKLPECNFLTLQHHMLGPVQRVPRYRLLLDDYVKRLPKDSADYEDATTALKLITESATHSNETMKKIENFHRLVNIFNNLADVNFDIVDVSRELLKEGKIIKISARNGEKQERYLYLFSDMLLCCAPNRRLGKNYKVTAKIDLDGMTVNEILNPNLPFAFCVNGLQKSMEFATNVQEDKEKWLNAIQDAIEERKDRQRTFKSFISEQNQIEDVVSPIQTPSTPSVLLPSPSPIYTRQVPAVDIDDADLGTRAPRWIKDHEVTMCMCCSKGFNRLLRRRHHCRACGRVVCSECSENKATLQYDTSKPMKVCSRCFDVLAGRRPSDVRENERKGVLEVEADAVSEKSAIASYLFFSENVKKKGWARTWCVIPSDELCLYFYKAHQDVRAQMTLPLPGFDVQHVEYPEHKYNFKLLQAGKSYFFACDDKLTAEKWKYALNQGSRGYDLTKKQVDTLGQHQSSSESKENHDQEEILEKKQKAEDNEEEEIAEKSKISECKKEKEIVDENKETEGNEEEKNVNENQETEGNEEEKNVNENQETEGNEEEKNVNENQEAEGNEEEKNVNENQETEGNDKNEIVFENSESEESNEEKQKGEAVKLSAQRDDFNDDKVNDNGDNDRTSINKDTNSLVFNEEPDETSDEQTHKCAEIRENNS